MSAHSLCRGYILFFTLALVVSLCIADSTIFEVSGIGQCSDCNENTLKAGQAFSGLHVTIDCKLKTGEIKRVGAGELDKQGKFKVSLPQHIVQEDGRNLKHECYAQLHSSVSLPCPTHNGLEASKIVFKSLNNKRITFGPIKNLQFSNLLCTSKFFLPCPPFFKPKTLPPPARKVEPPVVKVPPPTPNRTKPKSKPPVMKSPPSPVDKPGPKAGPKSKSPTARMHPPPAPIYKKPPFNPPVVIKPMPPPFPLFPFPPFHKKPCPLLHKLPHFPMIPPKFEFLPPLPPYIPYP